MATTATTTETPEVIDLAHESVGDLEDRFGVEAPSFCHLCGDVIDYCQGHGGETCDCICDEGCYCGECDFVEEENRMALMSVGMFLETEGHTVLNLY